MSTSAPKSFSIRRLARIVIEFTTPFHVGTGDAGYGADALVVTDANGLPAIPGSSLAGALRAAYSACTSAPDSDRQHRADTLFGFQCEDNGQGSRLSVSWAAIHNAKDQPVEGILTESGLAADPVLQQAFTLQPRDHVRLTHRGGAAHRGKFDEQPVAAGHRFTFELELIDQPGNENDWIDLIQVLHSPILRLGGKSRRGYGAFKVVRLNEKCFNLANEKEFDEYASHPVALATQPDWCSTTSQSKIAGATAGAVTLTLRIQPRGFWMFGGGEDIPPNNCDPVDMAPLRQDRILWDKNNKNNQGTVVSGQILLPGSAIKGAISHRVAFHFNRLSNRRADKVARNCMNTTEGRADADAKLNKMTGGNNRAVRELFGYVEENKNSTQENGALRGRILLDDLFWPTETPSQQHVPHVTIDRFTGGAMDGRLFCERPLWQGSFPELKLTILDANNISPKIRKALHAALNDLIEGRLALGAGVGRGLGFFKPKVLAVNQKALECSIDGWFTPPTPTQPAASHAQQ